jgi:hypothetical protein
MIFDGGFIVRASGFDGGVVEAKVDVFFVYSDLCPPFFNIFTPINTFIAGCIISPFLYIAFIFQMSSDTQVASHVVQTVTVPVLSFKRVPIFKVENNGDCSKDSGSRISSAGLV